MLRWKLYYADRTTFSSADGEWGEAPVFGVMAVASPEPNVVREIDRARPGTGDYYIWDPDGSKPWWVDSGGLEDFLIRSGVMTLGQTLEQISPKDKIAVGVKYGRSVDNDTWRDLWDWIVADADQTFG